MDLVPRPRLTEWLDQRQGRPLTLVSAPAGYGKSTLISCWLESVHCPTAWLSLDEHDNEFGIFLRYFLAAIKTIFPYSIPETQAISMATTLPPNTTIANNLINELDQVVEPFILVLDDYHLIDAQPIHDLLNELLLHPPRKLHLVLGTRMDPPLPLVSLRANSKMNEIRIPDLRFNRDETQQLLQKMTGTTFDQMTANELESQSEGWVTGIRLAALAMQHRIGRDSLSEDMSLHNRYVTEYLLAEILAKQAARLSDCMLKTSILDRFCAELCEAVCFQQPETVGEGSGKAYFTGVQFLEWLRGSNLFVIPLDDQHVWFRYHHLFRDFLQQELIRSLSPDEIAELHAAAGRWYGQNGWIEEALHHLLAAHELDAAINLVAQHRYNMMNTTQWPRLDRWLNLFPAEVVETSAELWMLKTWLVYHHSQFSELPALLGHLAVILENEPNQLVGNDFSGEISALRSLIAYHAGDAGEAISQAQVALDILPPELWIVRVMVYMYMGGGMLLNGDENGGYHAFYDALEGEQAKNRRYKATLLMTACYFHWLTADLQSMMQASKQSIALCQESGYRQILGLAKYQLGCVRYQQNDLHAAEELLSGVVAQPYRNYATAYANSVCGLGMTYQALGKETEAREITEAGIAFLLENGITTLLPAVLALQAELALMQGYISVASQWAEKLDPIPPLVPMTWFLAPHLTLVKVWLAQNTPASLAKAAELINQLREYLEATHNTRFLIETLATQALLEHALGNQQNALAALERALRLAQPGGFIRLFLDLGPQMADLLTFLHADEDLQAYFAQILSAFPGAQQKATSFSQIKLLEPLTNRELEILVLLAERKTNKEIAMQLGITLGTVRQHSHNLYQKLEVSNRREAVTRAIDLDLLTG